ncbi:SLBB domain-containing protein [Plesiomonas sp.]|uniref:polysaccharide biosynthesis/export family protein n=1 Tax=Plesiomonas sp. TaxID=2486279 RepID=UPI003EE70050
MNWLRIIQPIFFLSLFLFFGILPTPVNAEPASSVSTEVAPDTLRPGDLIFINLPGESAFNEPFQINRQGNVQLPEIGDIKLLGLSLAEATPKIRQQLQTVFKDLSGFSVRIKERLLLVNVMGYVRKPGSYQLPENANVQLAIESANGLVPGAQLSNIQVQRKNQKIAFDYKHYLDTGDSSEMPSLQTLDTVFIPASPLTGNVQIDFDAATLSKSGDAADAQRAIKVFGEVNTPGAYSIKPGETVVDMLMRAGGVTRYAGVERIRVISNNEPTLFDLKKFLDTGDKQFMPEIAPGSTIFIPKDEEQIKKGTRTVYIMGEVAKPGAYESRKGDTFMDILANAGGPTRYSESRQIRIIRADGSIEPFDLQGYTEGLTSRQLPAITPGDAIFIPEKTDINEKSWLKVSPKHAVMVIGQVNKPGRYEWSDEMSLLDLLANAGGPSDKADTSKVQILITENGRQAKPTYFDLTKFLKDGGNLDQIPNIRAGYTINIPQLPNDPKDNKSQWVQQAPENSIYIMGQVGAPGRYAFTSEMGFLDILAAADGPTEKADLRNIRVAHRNGGSANVTKLDLSLYFESGDESLLPKVVTGDSIYIPEKDRLWLDTSKESTVRIMGAIGKPGRYRFNESMTLLDLLAEAGGPTSSAYVQKIIVANLSESGKNDQARTFDLLDFMKSPDFSQLPILRAGDTVYIPDTKDSNWSVFMGGMTDIFTILSVLTLLIKI